MDKRDFESITITEQDREDGYVACDSCGHDFIVGEEAQMTGDHIFCRFECIAEWEQNQAEAANERFIERYYGGDTPVTQQEQYEQAWREKRGMK